MYIKATAADGDLFYCSVEHIGCLTKDKQTGVWWLNVSGQMFEVSEETAAHLLRTLWKTTLPE